jgi:methionyl-tRNA formyltransferase
MTKPLILFFGSSQYSLLVLQALLKAGYRPQVVTDTPVVKTFCEKHRLTLNPVEQSVKMPDIGLIVSADYGRKIPLSTLKSAQLGALNLHPSLLPKYRGATPVPHTLLNREKTTCITIIQMTDRIDSGPIIARKTLKISPQDTSETLLTRCFTLGAKLLISILPKYLEQKITPKPQPVQSPTPYCRRFTKQDGYISWSDFVNHSQNQFKDINHRIRAFSPWPGVWTKMPDNRILKLLPDQMVQLEGKQPIGFKQFSAGYQHLLK